MDMLQSHLQMDGVGYPKGDGAIPNLSLTHPLGITPNCLILGLATGKKEM